MTEQELYNEYRKSDCKSFTDFLIKKITELKKENTELKRDNEVMRDGLGCKTCVKFAEKQLAKAITLLKEVQVYTENIDDEADALYDKIQQFLNENEVEG